MLALLAALVVVAACSSGPVEDTVTGVVSAVTGPGEAVTSFVIEQDDGSSRVFLPAAALTCDGEPLNHLREHLLERDRISVRFERADEGPDIAVEIVHLD